MNWTREQSVVAHESSEAELLIGTDGVILDVFGESNQELLANVKPGLCFLDFIYPAQREVFALVLRQASTQNRQHPKLELRWSRENDRWITVLASIRKMKMARPGSQSTKAKPK